MKTEAPVTTRVGGGVTARMAVVLVMAALAVIVGVAFLNRPPARQARRAGSVAPVATASAVLAAWRATHRQPARYRDGACVASTWATMRSLS